MWPVPSQLSLLILLFLNFAVDMAFRVLWGIQTAQRRVPFHTSLNRRMSWWEMGSRPRPTFTVNPLSCCPGEVINQQQPQGVHCCAYTFLATLAAKSTMIHIKVLYWCKLWGESICYPCLLINPYPAKQPTLLEHRPHLPLFIQTHALNGKSFFSTSFKPDGHSKLTWEEYNQRVLIGLKPPINKNLPAPLQFAWSSSPQPVYTPLYIVCFPLFLFFYLGFLLWIKQASNI